MQRRGHERLAELGLTQYLADLLFHLVRTSLIHVGLRGRSYLLLQRFDLVLLSRQQ